MFLQPIDQRYRESLLDIDSVHGGAVLSASRPEDLMAAHRVTMTDFNSNLKFDKEIQNKRHGSKLGRT